MTKIQKIKKSKKKFFSTFVPENPGIRDEEEIPDLIIFIKRFGVKYSTESRHEYSTYSYNTIGPSSFRSRSKNVDCKELSFVYFFWDNKQGKIIGYEELSKKVEMNSQKQVDRMIAEFTAHIIKSVKLIKKKSEKKANEK